MKKMLSIITVLAMVFSLLLGFGVSVNANTIEGTVQKIMDFEYGSRTIGIWGNASDPVVADPTYSTETANPLSGNGSAKIEVPAGFDSGWIGSCNNEDAGGTSADYDGIVVRIKIIKDPNNTATRVKFRPHFSWSDWMSSEGAVVTDVDGNTITANDAGQNDGSGYQIYLPTDLDGYVFFPKPSGFDMSTKIRTAFWFATGDDVNGWAGATVLMDDFYYYNSLKNNEEIIAAVNYSTDGTAQSIMNFGPDSQTLTQWANASGVADPVYSLESNTPLNGTASQKIEFPSDFDTGWMGSCNSITDDGGTIGDYDGIIMRIKIIKDPNNTATKVSFRPYFSWSDWMSSEGAVVTDVDGNTITANDAGQNDGSGYQIYLPTDLDGYVFFPKPAGFDMTTKLRMAMWFATGDSVNGWAGATVLLDDFYYYNSQKSNAVIIAAIEGEISVENVPVTGVTVTSEAQAVVGNTCALTARVSPSNASNKAAIWVSDDEAIATVNTSGVVTGVAPGIVDITATTVDGSFSGTCSFTVTATAPSLHLTTIPTYNNAQNWQFKGVPGNGSWFFIKHIATGKYLTYSGGNIVLSIFAASGEQYWSCDRLGNNSSLVNLMDQTKGIAMVDGQFSTSDTYPEIIFSSEFSNFVPLNSTMFGNDPNGTEMYIGTISFVQDKVRNYLSYTELETADISVDFGNYRVAGYYISKIQPNTSTSEFLAGVTPQSGTELVFNNLAANNIIQTGTTIDVMVNEVKTKTYTAIIYGDIDGDGVISISDLAAIKGHLLKINVLTGVNLEAANIHTKTSLSISNLLAIKRQILGIASIAQ